ncbi:hypothetical protein H5968_23060 [Sphaerospermopsis sp. LEGE 00249]|nr:hypothetical protein [Sphaerospermopsis sp. LEGE 00249]MBC5797948.1 hypothetical protein [Sphaerospermopsis sp. LEGE 00249]
MVIGLFIFLSQSPVTSPQSPVPSHQSPVTSPQSPTYLSALIFQPGLTT